MGESGVGLRCYVSSGPCVHMTSLRFILHRVTTSSLLPHISTCDEYSCHARLCPYFTDGQTLNAQIMIKTESIKYIIITAINQDTHNIICKSLHLLLVKKETTKLLVIHFVANILTVIISVSSIGKLSIEIAKILFQPLFKIKYKSKY